MNERRQIVFYRTLPIDPDSKSGSGVRPVRLLDAFRRLGYDVEVVAGRAPERKRAMREVEQKLQSGVRYDFLYAEPPTTPVPLNETHHLPVHPLMDYRFLMRCHSSGVPVALFYRDVQWRLPHYPRSVGWPKYAFMLPFFHADLAVYRRCVDAWLVPDLGMRARIAPWLAGRPVWASPPGFDETEAPSARVARSAGAPLRLFYVGGIEPPVYDLLPLLRGMSSAVKGGIGCELTICCRQAEWARGGAAYASYLGDHVQVVHNRSRRELLDLYARHDVAVMPYGTLNSDWAMPVKFAEAIGLFTPVLSGVGTAVGKAVAEQGIGWVVGSSPEEFAARLATVDEAALEGARAAVARVRPSYSWTERARQIAVIAGSVRVSNRDQVERLA